MLSPLFSAAQAAGAESWLDSLGPFLPFGALAMIVIAWLAKQLTESRQREREMADRALEQAERTLPLLAEVAAALNDATREAQRRDR